MSHVICHVPCVTCHMSCVTCHMSHFFFTKWWLLLVEGLLSMGPTPSSLLTARLNSLLWVAIFFLVSKINEDSRERQLLEAVKLMTKPPTSLVMLSMPWVCRLELWAINQSFESMSSPHPTVQGSGLATLGHAKSLLVNSSEVRWQSKWSVRGKCWNYLKNPMKLPIQ